MLRELTPLGVKVHRRRRAIVRDRRRSARSELRGAARELAQRSASRRSSTPFARRSRASSPPARSAAARTWASPTRRSRCPSACRRWCAPIVPVPARSSRSTSRWACLARSVRGPQVDLARGIQAPRTCVPRASFAGPTSTASRRGRRKAGPLLAWCAGSPRRSVAMPASEVSFAARPTLKAMKTIRREMAYVGV